MGTTAQGSSTTALSCRLLGHRPAFRSAGRRLVWECERDDCDMRGAKEYASPETAQRFADAFDRRDSADLGRRAPLLGLFPLRLWHRMRRSAS
ncbi:MAG: hypothetical protein ACTHKG_11325 [Nocardioides sp.]